MDAGRFEQFSSAITQITKSIHRIKNREMRKLGLRGSHVMCLFYLRRNAAGLTAAELSELCELDKGAVSRAVAELERMDYLSCPEPASKRKYRARITLTERGRRLADKIAYIIDDTGAKVGRGLGETERKFFFQTLFQISENLKELAGL
jgi:DNA-binding MarR family transcriptional regulator